MGLQKSTIVLCLLPLIESGRCGSHVVAAAADVIAANARFNMWAYQMKEDPRISDDDFLQLLDLSEEATQACQAAVHRFHDTGDWRELVETLHRVAEKLNQRPEWVLSSPHAPSDDQSPRSAK